MSENLSIGRVSALSGLSARTIRFYEDEGYVPPAARSASGYRTYSPADVRRFKLVKLARVLGLPLVEVKALVHEAFTVECAQLTEELTSVIDRQQALIARRIAELQALAGEVDGLRTQIQNCTCEPGSTLADCDGCAILG